LTVFKLPKLDTIAYPHTIRAFFKGRKLLVTGRLPKVLKGDSVTSDTIKVTEEIVSCSDNGQHPLVYIKLTSGTGKCQYCGQVFERVKEKNSKAA